MSDEQLGPCPDARCVERFFSGLLDDEETEAVHRHLASCDVCDRRAAAASTDDEIAGLLREAHDELDPDERREIAVRLARLGDSSPARGDSG